MSSDDTRLTCKYVAPEPADPRFDYDSLVDDVDLTPFPYELPDEEEEVHVYQENTRSRCDDPEYDWIPAPEWFPHTRSRCDDPQPERERYDWVANVDTTQRLHTWSYSNDVPYKFPDDEEEVHVVQENTRSRCDDPQPERERYDWVPRTWSLVNDPEVVREDPDWFPHTWSRCDDLDDHEQLHQASVPLPNTVEELYKQVNMDIDAAINQYDMDIEDANIGNGCLCCGIACEASYCSEQCWLNSDECKDTCGRTFGSTCGSCGVNFTYPEFQYYEYDYEYRGLDGEIDPDVGKNVYACHDCFCENSTAQRTYNQNFPLTDYPWQHHPVLSAITAFQHLRIYNQAGDLQMWADVYQYQGERSSP